MPYFCHWAPSERVWGCVNLSYVTYSDSKSHDRCEINNSTERLSTDIGTVITFLSLWLFGEHEGFGLKIDLQLTTPSHSTNSLCSRWVMSKNTSVVCPVIYLLTEMLLIGLWGSALISYEWVMATAIAVIQRQKKKNKTTTIFHSDKSRWHCL